jgi:MoxR-like ATPase
MTDVDVERILLKHDEALDRIESSIEQNERLLASILKSQERFEKNLSRHDDLLEEIQKTMARHSVIFERVELRHEQYLANFNIFTGELIQLKDIALKNNGRLDRIESNLDRLTELQVKSNGRLDRIEENIKQLTEAQIKTDQQIRSLAQMKRPARKSSKKRGPRK